MWTGIKRILVIIVLLALICPVLARMVLSAGLSAQGLMTANLFSTGIVVLLVAVMVVGGASEDE